MTELVIHPEMIGAGIETLAECRKRELTDAETAVAVYLAMQAVAEMASMQTESVH